MGESSFLVVSALGADRPGLVAELTAHFRRRGLNVEDSRMAVLGGEFGVMLLLRGEPSVTSGIEADLPALERETGMAFLLRKTKSPAEHRQGAGAPFLVIAEALDHEGIVHSLVVPLRDLGVNIVSLETTSYPAPVTGSPLFRLEAHIDLPITVPASKMKRALEDVADRENLEVSVKPVTRGR